MTVYLATSLAAAVVDATVERMCNEGGKNRTVVVVVGFLWKWNSFSRGNCSCDSCDFLAAMLFV